MHRYDYILFDFDGTLLDSQEGIIESLKHTIEFNNIEVAKDIQLSKFIGLPIKDSFVEYCSMSDKEAEDSVNVFRDYYSKIGIFKSNLYKGVEDLLNNISKDKQIFVVTSKPQVFTELLIKHFNINRYFKSIIGSTLDNTLKNKDELIKCLLMNNNIKEKSKVIMIGDQPQDIIGAKACNIDSIAVTYGYGNIEDLKSLEPTFLVDSILKLKDILV